jgi:iron-only hydrogenase group A
MEKINIIINGKKIEADVGELILDVAEKNNIAIANLCRHKDLDIKANCRLCMVEIKGKNGLFPACSTLLEEGMEITTESSAISRARKINLELIFSQHCEECDDCVRKYNCKLLALAGKYKIDINRFKDRKKNFPVYEFGPSLIFDSSKCIDCRNCVEMCERQGIGFLELKDETRLRPHGLRRGEEGNTNVVPSANKFKDCIYCGQCLAHCPAGAFEAVGEFEDIEKPLSDKNKFVVFQIAPSIRSSIGEEFDLPYGKIMTEQIAGGIKKLGADMVFDVSVGADFTSFEEAKELAERLEKGGALPMFTSCCPAWVKFVEFYHPELIPNFTSSRSPQIMLGGLIKTYFAEKQGLDPKNIIVVSIMPCVAKKYEIKKEELRVNGMSAVDFVLTTRELAFLFKKRHIDLEKIKPAKLDNPLGEPSGAGVIYGASGGVMESALRVACEMISGKKLFCLDFKGVRGQEGIKKADAKIGDRIIKVAAISGIGNAIKIIKELKDNPRVYDYIEVMACPGGCIGGGGQPIPADKEIRKKRADSLYSIDENKKIRSALRNPILKKVYKDFLTDEEKIQKIFHTKYFPKKREIKL